MSGPSIESAPTSKTRKPRSASKFIVLREFTEVIMKESSGDINGRIPASYTIVASGNTIKDCRKKVAKDKIAGNLMICTVRRVGKSSVQETMSFEGL